MSSSKRVASRYIQAKSMESILSSTSRKVIDASKSLSVQNNGDGTFKVSGGKDTHTVKTQRNGQDIKVSCTCNAWVFQGSEYYAHEKGYLLGKPRGNLAPPKVRDPKGINASCKHVAAVFSSLSSMVRLGRREDILENLDIQKSICQDVSDWKNILNVIEFDPKLDFPANDEALISETIQGDKRYKDQYAFSHPKIYSHNGRKTPTIISFTEHAITRAISRDISTTEIRDLIVSTIDKSPERFIKKLNKAKKRGKALYIGDGTVVAVIRIHTIKNRTKAKDTSSMYRNQEGSWSYNKELGIIVKDKNTHIRVYTLFSDDSDVGEPLGEDVAARYLPCPLPDFYDEFSTHTEQSKLKNYEWSYRLAGMVQRITKRWLDR